MHSLVKNLKLFRKALLINVKFFLLNILKTTHNSVWERVKNALSCTLLHLVFKIFKKKNFPFIKTAFVNSLRFFTNKCTHLLKPVILGRKVLKMQRYSSVTLHVSPKNSISAENLKITFAKIQILCHKFFFLSGLVQNKLKLYVFEMDFMTNQLKLTVPKKCWFRSWKGSNIWTLF